MKKYHESEIQFKFSWSEVCKAFWCKYPNPYSTHVLTEDVIERHVDSQGRLSTKRLISKTSGVPKWFDKLGLLPKSRICFLIEESLIDPARKVFTTYTRNIGMKSVMGVEEKVIMRANPLNPRFTHQQRLAVFESNVRGFSSTICHFGSENFRYSVQKAAKGFQLVLEAMHTPQVMLSAPQFDLNTLSQLHPMLRNRILEKARSLKEVAKEAAIPLLSVAAVSNETPQKNVN